MNDCIYNDKKDKLNIILNNYKYKDEIEKISNINLLTEIFYYTYINYNKNYFNITNIKNIYYKENQFKTNKFDIIKEKDKIILEKDNKLDIINIQ